MRSTYWAFRCVAIVGLLLGDTVYLFAHGGGLDSNGGHNDRKNGGYHYHRAPSRPDPIETKPAEEEEPAPTTRKARTSYRTSARTTARTEAPVEPRVVAVNDYASMPHQPISVKEKKPLLPAHFRVKFENGTTKEIVSYERLADRYMFHMTYGGTIGFPREVVAQIDPLDDVATPAGT